MKRGGANVKEAERWLRQAEADLDAARLSRGGNHHEWACFQAQQVGEEALKAVLLSTGYRNISGHSVVDLLDALVKERPELASLETAAKDLDGVYIPSRYPNGIPGNRTPMERFSDKESRPCLASAESILLAATSIVRGSSPSRPN